MRLYPPVITFVSRECLQDYKYKDITIPKGTSIQMAVHYLHHNPDYWPEPEVFDAERFSADQKHLIHPNSWQPFGCGPRNCIGLRFALFEAKLCLAKLLLNYRLIPGPKTEMGKLTTECKVLTSTPKHVIRANTPTIIAIMATLLAPLFWSLPNHSFIDGTLVQMAVHYLHHDPDYWPEPEVFDPERFSADRKHEIHPNSWQAFGCGPRNCIGMRFALFEAKLCLAKLLLNYRLIPGPKTEIGKLTTECKVLTSTPKHVGYYMGAKPTVLVADADLAKKIQIKEFHNFTDRSHSTFKNGINAEPDSKGAIIRLIGKRWKEVRSVLTPTFSASKLKTMTPIIDDAINNFIDIIERKCKTGEEFDIYDLFQNLTTDVIGRTAFGIQNSKISREEMSSMSYETMTAGNENEIQPKGHKSIKNNKNDISLTDSEIKANSVVFYEAGYETTSTALGFMAHILVNYPDIQERVREEVQQLYENEGKLDINCVNKLEFMECVFNETMRLYPPVITFVARECLQDYKYKDITIPKGTSIQMAVHYLHHDPDYWSEPEVFDPERFSADRKHQIHPNSWQAFGSGPRNCIGMRFALFEAKLALAKLLLNYRLTAGPKTEMGVLATNCKVATLTPKNGVFVKAVKI
ncbi:unnamed protein product [Medioppia subpectinata]|uniref:Cytochrome P450 n=1 Tax=Medioppia subpectinata TaxID=1979941 RepID=A0A7R9Q470_9ACAR|nr:unnamed protein product [Medioppia subpectinata]CAG2112282.1 unnamed protein product [Medioppia subpectinata]